MKYCLFYLSVYNFIFPIRLTSIPKSEFIFFAIPFLWLLINFNKFQSIFTYKRYKTSFFYVLLLFVIGMLSSLLNNGDYMSLTIFFKFFFSIILSTSILLWGINLFGDRFFEKLLSVIVFSGLIISVTNVIEFFHPPFRFFLLEVISVTGNTDYEMSFRTHGFASGGGSSLSLGILIISILSFFKFKKAKNKFKKLLFYLSFLFLYISTIVIGRTGFFVGTPIIMYLLFFEGISFYGFFKRIILGFVIFTALNQIILIIAADDLNILFKFGLEPVYNYIENGSFESRTSIAVAQMYYIPDAVHVLFGAGYWRWPTHGYDLSDVGYMKILMSTGIFGVLIFYSYQVIIYKEAFSFYKNRYNFKIGFLFLFLVLFIVELKESVFTQNYGSKVLIALIVFSWIEKAKNKKRLECVE